MDDIFAPIDIETTEVDQDPVATLVGEGKKFKDISELAKAKLEADRFIEKLKQEAEELRQEVRKTATIDEILTQIRQAQPQAEPRQSTPQEPQRPVEPSTPDIESLVEQLLQKKEVEKKVSTNVEQVKDKLSKAYGADAQLHVNKKARELGVTVDYLMGIAKESPSAFFRLTGLDQSASPAPQAVAPQSRVQTLPQGSGSRDKAFYERLKAADRTKYFSPEIQLQMYKDMEAALKQGKAW